MGRGGGWLFELEEDALLPSFFSLYDMLFFWDDTIWLTCTFLNPPPFSFSCRCHFFFGFLLSIGVAVSQKKRFNP